MRTLALVFATIVACGGDDSPNLPMEDGGVVADAFALDVSVIDASHPESGGVDAATESSTTSTSGVYGSINADTKANIRVGPEGAVSHRFRASTSSALESVRFSQRGGPVYSGGTGGTMTISVHDDDGTGNPKTTALASLPYTPGNPSGGGWTTYLDLAFPTPPALTKGNLYHVVFENTDASPSTNYISVNEVFIYGGALTPRQPTFPDSDYAVLKKSSTWSLQKGYTADMDVTYANGAHDGMGYIQAMIANYGVISGASNMVREHFTVSGGDKTVTTASVRVRRSSGSSPLTIRLLTGAGALIEAVNVPSSSVPVSAPGGDNGGAVWVTATFLASHVLTDASTYDLQLSTASDTEYTACPVREGTDSGFQSFRFTDGDGQHTTDGTTWANLYLYSPVDLQFYFETD